MEKKKYYPEIDICKGIGILLVVLGHALKQTGETNRVFEILLSVIYSFHMPLFFCLSGFVSAKILRMTGGSEKIEYLKGRAFRLLIPYFVVGLLYVPLKFYLSKFALKPYDFRSLWKVLIGENPNTALWFLYILFWVIVLTVFFATKNNLSKLTAGTMVISLLAFAMNWPVKTMKYWFFFMLGLYMNQTYEWIKGQLKKAVITYIMLLIFVAANILLYLNGWGWCQFVTSVSGIWLTVWISCCIAEKSSRNIFAVLGKYNMDVYILSEPVNTITKLLFWNILHLGYIPVTLLCFLAATIVPIPASLWVVRKIKILRIGILGMK